MVVRSALLLLSGNVATSFVFLLRSLIVARLIPVADFGIAATFALALALVDMLAALGLNLQIVQARDGNDPRLQAALQGFQVFRGLTLGAVMFVLAGPLADFMNIPEAAWGYRVLVLVLVVRAFGHFDVFRFNRSMRFGPTITTQLVPALVSLAAIWPLALWLGDWRVMLFSIMIQTGLGTLLSHLVAHRPYRLALDRQLMARSLRFGWPLLINNIMLFLVFNGDKLAVGRELGMEALAIFAMGVTLTLTPTTVLSKSTSTLLLPRLAAAMRDTAAGEAGFQRTALASCEYYLVLSMSLVVVIALLGPPLVVPVLGEKFASLAALLVPMAVLQSLRMIKGGPGVVALSRGVTSNAAMANLSRVALLPVAWVLLLQGGDLVTLVHVATVGELLGAVVAYALVRRATRMPLRGLLGPVALAGAFYATALVLAYGPDVAPAWALLGLMVALVLATVAASPNLREMAWRQLRRKGQ